MQSDNASPSSFAFWPTSASTAWPHYTCPSFMCRHRRKPVIHDCVRLRRIHCSCHGLAHATETGTSPYSQSGSMERSTGWTHWLQSVTVSF